MEQPRPAPRAWSVLAAVSLIFFFASAATFASLGIAVFAMLPDMHWSEAAAGGAFLMLGLACCIFALTPVFMIARIGVRRTLVTGCTVLAIGFTLAAFSRSLAGFYAATVVVGGGFSLVANTPGIHAIAAWFATRSPRMIGLYMTAGALGNAAGPPATALLIAVLGGWRAYWVALALVALLLAMAAAIMVRDHRPAPDAPPEASADDWPIRAALTSPRFAIIAAAMVATQACLLTVASVAAPHLVSLGGTAGYAAGVLGSQALVAALSTAVLGWLAGGIDPRRMQAAGLVIQALSLALFGLCGIGWTTWLFALLFGVGTSVTCLGVTLLLIRSFGIRSGTAALSTVWMLSGLSALGPAVAGTIAEATGGFRAALLALGALLLPVALATMVMPEMRRRPVARKQQVSDAVP